jgi:KUP system potassium uptake protein
VSPSSDQSTSRGRVAALTLGAIGVVYGDIGTSPLYAFREALAQLGSVRVGHSEIVGVLSLALWALIIVVTIKYVLFLTRTDNQGEGGVLSLMALASRATQGRWPIVLLLGGAGAALFYGDAIITPALSVLSAVEGIKSIPSLAPYVTPATTLALTLGILIALFSVQARGTASVARLFGPICVLWFLSLAVLGIVHIADEPAILAAFNPLTGVAFLTTHGTLGLFVLGAVFLTVTGAEALIADMGHFGRLPIQVGWLGLVWPALTLNYLGQGAMALSALENAQAAGRPFANADWFFLMAPDWGRAPLVMLATAATVIASQAVITGAYSLTSQAIALGLLPRMRILQTAAYQRGQIYMPAVNWLLLVGVVVLVLAFRTSSAMAAAYGIAVTGTMVITTCLAFIVLWKAWGWDIERVTVLILPFLALDLVFFGANILRVTEGGWVPLLIAAIVGMIVWSWMTGRRAVAAGIDRNPVPIAELAVSLARRPPPVVEGTAVFLTQNNEDAPTALLHSLKHGKALHARNLLLSVVTAEQPTVPSGERLSLMPVDDRFTRATLRYGYMDRVDLPSDLGAGYDGILAPGGVSFFVGRNTLRRARNSQMPEWMLPIYAFLHRNAADPTGFMGIPPNRVVELGAQVEL